MSDNNLMKICSIEGCGIKHRAKGMCQKHYKAALFASTYIPKKKNLCSVCGAEHWGKLGLCRQHYDEAYRKSDARKNVSARYAKTDHFKRTQQRWIKSNGQKKRALTNAYRARLRAQTPAWADQRAITKFYELAQAESARTGSIIEVDHIIPLRGRAVSGLHVSTNLQLLCKSDNSRKGNRL